jgi:CRP/FNR family cyclic AMP-dependent transcriptional regulator
MEQRDYDAGEVILVEGQDSDFVYRIESGEVEVFTELEGRAVLLGTVKAGEFLGEMGIIEGQPRSASARAKSYVTAALLERVEFFRLMSEDSSSAHRLITRLCERLRAASRKIAEATVSGEVHPYVMEDTTSTGESLTHPSQSDVQAKLVESRLTLLSASQQLASHLPKKGISVTELPFSVGRSPLAKEPRPSVPIDLTLPDSKPFRLSRQHFALSRHQGKPAAVDLGSTLGTEVNGEPLGYHFGKDLEYLIHHSPLQSSWSRHNSTDGSSGILCLSEENTRIDPEFLSHAPVNSSNHDTDLSPAGERVKAKSANKIPQIRRLKWKITGGTDREARPFEPKG